MVTSKQELYERAFRNLKKTRAALRTAPEDAGNPARKSAEALAKHFLLDRFGRELTAQEQKRDLAWMLDLIRSLSKEQPARHVPEEVLTDLDLVREYGNAMSHDRAPGSTDGRRAQRMLSALEDAHRWAKKNRAEARLSRSVRAAWLAGGTVVVALLASISTFRHDIINATEVSKSGQTGWADTASSVPSRLAPSPSPSLSTSRSPEASPSSSAHTCTSPCCGGEACVPDDNVDLPPNCSRHACTACASGARCVAGACRISLPDRSWSLRLGAVHWRPGRPTQAEGDLWDTVVRLHLKGEPWGRGIKLRDVAGAAPLKVKTEGLTKGLWATLEHSTRGTLKEEPVALPLKLINASLCAGERITFKDAPVPIEYIELFLDPAPSDAAPAISAPSSSASTLSNSGRP